MADPAGVWPNCWSEMRRLTFCPDRVSPPSPLSTPVLAAGSRSRPGLGGGGRSPQSPIQENLFPHQLVDMARREGCGEAYLASAILSTLVTLMLIGTFVWSFYRKSDRKTDETLLGQHPSPRIILP